MKGTERQTGMRWSKGYDGSLMKVINWFFGTTDYRNGFLYEPDWQAKGV